MRAALPAAKREQFFKGLAARFGALREFGKPHWESDSLAVFPATFEHGALDMKLCLDGCGSCCRAGPSQNRRARKITLLDLAARHSGLPRLPHNLQAAGIEDPYAGYGAAKLCEFVAKHGVRRPADAAFNYSNLGLGEVTEPLGLGDTVVKLSPEQQKRFAPGHNAQHQAAGGWNFDALAGAGAIRSTAGDMLTYLEAQLHPDLAAGSTLASALLGASRTGWESTSRRASAGRPLFRRAKRGRLLNWQCVAIHLGLP